jgi:DNA invertase Pin-like site-specific DNA recombinase
MQTAIIYTRVSTEEQNEKGYSLADQEDKLRRFCQNKGIEIIQHFQDAHSAKTFDRPEFKNLLSFIKKNKGLVKKLLVVKWDRFSRNMEASLTMISQLFKLGVTVEALEQPLDDSVP